MPSIRLLSLRIHSVGPVGFEPTTYGLKETMGTHRRHPRPRATRRRECHDEYDGCRPKATDDRGARDSDSRPAAPGSSVTTAVVAEKRSVARVLGASQRGAGHVYGNGYVVTGAIGRLVALALPPLMRADRPR